MRSAYYASFTILMWAAMRAASVMRLRLSARLALRRRAYHGHLAWTQSRALSRDPLNPATCLSTRKPPRTRRGPSSASSSAQHPLERISPLRALVFTCSVVLCLAGVALPSPGPTLSTSDPSLSRHDAFPWDAQCAMVDHWHSSTAQDMSVVVDGISDSTHASAHARQIDNSMPVPVMTPEGVGDVPRPVPQLALPAYVPLPSIPASDRPSDADATPSISSVGVDPAPDPSTAVECLPCDITVTPAATPPHPIVAAAAWSRRRSRTCGSLVSHARFLQHLVRGYSRLRPSGWVRGGLHGAPMPYRPVTTFRCRGGMCLAGPERFAEMQGHAARLIEWYTLYVDIYRVMAGRPPRTYHPFSAAGADAEGVRRAGGQPHGSDSHDQPAFRSWFGDEAFEVGDAAVLSDLMRRVSSWDSVFISASAPCQAYSTTDIHHLSDAPRLIPLIRDHLRATGRLYALENVKGAASDLLDSAQLLYGAFFGLGVDRPRFFETSFDLVIDEYIRAPGLALRRDSCLGPTRRWRRLDPCGRPEMTECCTGNIIPVQGKAPVGCTLEQSARAMGIDPSHMPYERLAQAIPPVYEQLVFTQACMAACHSEYGVPSITFDEMLLDPETSRRTLAFWLRGAGAPSPDAGLTWSPAHREPRPVPAAAPAQVVRPPGSRSRGPAAVESIDGDVAVVEEVEFREVQYSSVGGFTQQHVPSGAQRWLDVLVDSDAFQGGDRAAWLAGGNTHIECSLRDLRGWVAPVLAARSSAPDTRVTVQLPPVGAESAQQLRDAGFIFRRRSVRGPPVFAEADAPALLPSPSEWWSFGSRRSLAPAHVLDLADAENRMDPRDRGEFADDPDRKRMRAYLPVPWDPASWHDTGLPTWIESMMQEGVIIRPEVEPPFADHPFYQWDSSEALHRAIVEADRHLSVGSLEYIPHEEVAGVAESTIVHPWVVVQQGEKWRLCHDYSVGTNLYVPSAPFGLPSPWDVRPAVRAGSRFAKYDIRDGFFHVPVHPDSRRRLVVRHPGTGRLLWAPRLPFGYVDSPRLFCGVMEAIADKLRSQVSGRGIHFYVFVDDWLVVGDDYDLTVEGCSMLEAELRARGISWAPHKHRVEFLGLLLANIDGKMSISLTRARRDGLLELIDSWEEWGQQLLAEGRTPSSLPVPLASLLGKLVFASQVVWNGIERQDVHAVDALLFSWACRRLAAWEGHFPGRHLLARRVGCGLLGRPALVGCTPAREIQHSVGGHSARRRSALGHRRERLGHGTASVARWHSRGGAGRVHSRGEAPADKLARAARHRPGSRGVRSMLTRAHRRVRDG